MTVGFQGSNLPRAIADSEPVGFVTVDGSGIYYPAAIPAVQGVSPICGTLAQVSRRSSGSEMGPSRASPTAESGEVQGPLGAQGRDDDTHLGAPEVLIDHLPTSPAGKCIACNNGEGERWDHVHLLPRTRRVGLSFIWYVFSVCAPSILASLSSSISSA